MNDPQSNGPIETASANSVESDLGCTLRIYFDYDNVMLTLHNVTLTSQKPCQHNNTISSVIAAKQTVINEVYVFFNIAMFY